MELNNQEHYEEEVLRGSFRMHLTAQRLSSNCHIIIIYGDSVGNSKSLAESVSALKLSFGWTQINK
ncbi:hypothetical protein BpHYR1_037065 [Brachionus plicatilis]|uniref:Uncharacterized protein n=1 Tax=Brachionus plicatilis TaxID=10195 RepID=A0A3M7QKE4_BRAPC|nr:hypothetical protein BpHYR1_037065 [Brachionus plicatilis]